MTQFNENAPSLCPACKKQLPAGGLTFCPYCGCTLSKNSSPRDTQDKAIREYLLRAEKITDLRKRKTVLLEARQHFPDRLIIEQELLMIGNPRPPKKNRLDFFIIKCCLLHLYLTPDAFGEEEKEDLRNELFSGEQLQKCLSLAPDAEAFRIDYLHRLCADFIRIFLRDSTLYNHTFLGFRIDRHPERTFAAPVAGMIREIERDEKAGAENTGLLRAALYRAFAEFSEGRTMYLDALLQP